MNEAVTMGELIKLATIIVGIWGFYKVIMEIVDRITARHDREQKWDEMAEELNSARQTIVIKYDAKLAELEKKIDDNQAETTQKIEESKAETDAKLQQFSAELYMQTITLYAVLDGLIQMNCNGKVTKAKGRLEKFFAGAANGVTGVTGVDPFDILE